MLQWKLVKVCSLCALVLTLSITACDQGAILQDAVGMVVDKTSEVQSSSEQDGGLRDAVIKAIDKTSEVQSFRSTTNKVIFSDNYVRSYSSLREHAAACTSHSSQITVETRLGNVTALPFDRDILVDWYGDWDLETGLPIKWSESIVIGGSGRMRSSSHPNWSFVLVSCVAGFLPLHNELKLYRFLIDLERLPDEDINGVNCSHYRGSVDFNSYVDWRIEETEGLSIVSVTGTISWQEKLERMRRSEAIAEFWVDGADYIRQLKTEKRSLSLAASGEEWTTEIMVTRYSDFNESIDIELPEETVPLYPVPTPTPTPWPTTTPTLWPPPPPTSWPSPMPTTTPTPTPGPT